MKRSLLYAFSGVLCLGVSIGLARVSESVFDTLEVLPAQAQTPSVSLEAMTLERLEAVLEREFQDLEGSQGQWQVTIAGRSLLVIADAANDRMRIMTPVSNASALSTQEIQAMLVANFHSALDARYAVTNGTVVSIFVHPLSTLQERDLGSALRQVATLAENFGTSYSSGGLGFGAIGEPSQGDSSAGDGFDI